MKRALGLLMGGLLLLPLGAGAQEAPRRLRTDVNRMALLAHVAEAHLEAGPRKSGAWTPELILSLTMGGDPLVSRSEPSSLASRRPTGMVGVTVAPLRFRDGGRQISVLDLDMGYGTSAGGSGTAVQIGVLKVGFPF